MYNDFVTFFSTESIIVFLLVLFRLTGMIATAPLFSKFPLPDMVKLGIGVLSAFIMYPFVVPQASMIIPSDLIGLSILIAKELFIGVTIGFCASLIFSGIQIGGQLLSMQMGLAMANALDPVTGQNTPIVGQFYLFIASFLFLLMNGHHWLFSTVHESFTSIPIGFNFEFNERFTQEIMLFSGNLFKIAFSLIIPIFQVLLISTILMGFMAKIMPQMNIFMIGMPVKIYIGLVMVLALMPTTVAYMMRLIDGLLRQLHAIFIF